MLEQILRWFLDRIGSVDHRGPNWSSFISKPLLSGEGKIGHFCEACHKICPAAKAACWMRTYKEFWVDGRSSKRLPWNWNFSYLARLTLLTMLRALLYVWTKNCFTSCKMESEIPSGERDMIQNVSVAVGKLLQTSKECFLLLP